MAPTLIILATIAMTILGVLAALVLMRASSYLRTKRLAEEQQVANEILQGHVSSMMGHAYNMKQNNSHGKLTPEEQAMLSDWACEQTLESARTLFGSSFTLDRQDLISRVNASVKMFKMHYFSSGMADVDTMRDVMNRGYEEGMDED